MESVWSEELEDKLVDLWQQHECLYQVTTGSYRDRVTRCRMRPVDRGSQSIFSLSVCPHFFSKWFFSGTDSGSGLCDVINDVIKHFFKILLLRQFSSE